MAVYTELHNDQLEALLQRYQLGRLKACWPVLDGIENTNYFLTLEPLVGGQISEYLLTLYEQLHPEELAFYFDWLAHLKRSRLPVAPAIVDSVGHCLQHIAGKPAALFEKLPGQHPHPINATQCRAVGEALAQLHNATGNLRIEHPNPRGLPWLTALAGSVTPELTAADRLLLEEALAIIQSLVTNRNLPKGLIHGDLFPDNTLFEGDQLRALVDFFNGGPGLLGYDLAVAANAWCANASGRLEPSLETAMIAGYCSHRPLNNAEREHWHSLLVFAATRFWLSRVAHQRRCAADNAATALRKHKDPGQFHRILAAQLQQFRKAT